MKLDRTKNYGFTLEESFEMKYSNKSYPNAKADFDDWFTEDEIKKLFPNQTLILRIESDDDRYDFLKAQVMYYQCDRNFALRKFSELYHSGDEYIYFRYHTLHPLIDDYTDAKYLPDLIGE